MNLVMRAGASAVSVVSLSLVTTRSSMSSGAGVATARNAGSSPVTWRTVRPSTATVSSWRAERSAWMTSRMRERAAIGERKVSISSSDATMACPR